MTAAQSAGKPVAGTHIRYLNPFPRNLGEILSRYEKVLVPELNLGQLSLLLNARYPVRTIGLNKVQGQPFTRTEILDRIEQILEAPVHVS